MFNDEIRNTSLVTLGAFIHRKQCCTTCNTSPLAESKMVEGVGKYVKHPVFRSNSVRCLASTISSNEKHDVYSGH